MSRLAKLRNCRVRSIAPPPAPPPVSGILADPIWSSGYNGYNQVHLKGGSINKPISVNVIKDIFFVITYHGSAYNLTSLANKNISTWPIQI